MLQFYKPNAKNTGSACSFSYNKNDKALWVNFIKQSSWNGQTKSGTFKTKNHPADPTNQLTNRKLTKAD